MHLREYSTEIIGRGKVREGHVARGVAEYYMSVENFPKPNNFRRIRAYTVH